MSNPQHTCRYRILGELAAGHHAVVFRGEDTALGRPVALKRIRANLLRERPHYREILVREAGYLATLEHPNVLPLYDFFESDEGPSLVMRLVETSLDRFVAEDPTRRLALGEIAGQVAAAVDYCASRGMAHRDLKPANVLLDRFGQAYLIDFGLAAAFEDDPSWSEPVGSQLFVSPEQFTDRFAGGSAENRSRSDQFAFGVTLYSLLTGQLPHDPIPLGEHQERPAWAECTALRLMRNESIVPCSAREPRLPLQVDLVIARMLSVDPSARYPSNVEASLDLERALAGYHPATTRVFVSFSTEDRSAVREYVDKLGEKGFAIWWDELVVPGEIWEDRIEEAMRTSQVMLLVHSQHSAVSEEVRNEWRYWLRELKKPVVVLRLDETQIPYPLFSLHHIDARGAAVEAVMGKLIEAILGQARPSGAARSSMNERMRRYVQVPDLGRTFESLLKRLSYGTYIPSEYRLSPDLGASWDTERAEVDEVESEGVKPE